MIKIINYNLEDTTELIFLLEGITDDIEGKLSTYEFAYDETDEKILKEVRELDRQHTLLYSLISKLKTKKVVDNMFKKIRADLKLQGGEEQ